MAQKRGKSVVELLKNQSGKNPWQKVCAPVRQPCEALLSLLEPYSETMLRKKTTKTTKTNGPHNYLKNFNYMEIRKTNSEC